MEDIRTKRTKQKNINNLHSRFVIKNEKENAMLESDKIQKFERNIRC